MTKTFEQKVVRDLWGDARTAYTAPTRRKRERKRYIEVTDSPLTSPPKRPRPPSGELTEAAFYIASRLGSRRDVGALKNP
jgi:hypothetical protein